MYSSFKNVSVAIAIFVSLGAYSAQLKAQHSIESARQVLERVVGKKEAPRFVLKLQPDSVLNYSIATRKNKVLVTGSSETALCRGVYDYLYHACNSMLTWSGKNIQVPQTLPPYTANVRSPYRYHYYFNVVTHGYTTAYWDWERWQKEIDWMAMHGINMPLLSGAHEAILYRVFKEIGLTDAEIARYFTGPAHFPWNKMGNITGWDGKLPASYFDKQIALNHQLLKRMKGLGMHPIVPAFAGFVPEAITRLFPKERVRALSWGGFDKQYQAHILDPGSDLFVKIGKLYIQKYEEEFGKQEFYIADSFNEMDVPLSANETEALDELAGYGESVYRSIKSGNPDAVWVMQGWTFPYQKKDGKLFWTPQRLHALVSRVPDNKLLLLDLANEYNRLWWKVDPSWKTYSGFFNKMWIYSFIPNMGGKTALNGDLSTYATIPFEALNYEKKGNLVGFGFAPEGIENNELIYELLADIAWKNKPFDLNAWIKKYATNRYGTCSDEMKLSFDYLSKSSLGSFTDHPRNSYQFRPDSRSKGTVNTSPDFGKAVYHFLRCKNNVTNRDLYQTDAIELVSQYLGLKADSLLHAFKATGETNKELLDKAMVILKNTDRLMESHPTWKLSRWTGFAKKWGDTPQEQQYYESNARRLITTWGGEVNEYAAKTWSGLLRDYYIPRWEKYYAAKRDNTTFDMLKWEENWIRSSQISPITPFANPLESAIQLFNEQYYSKNK